MRRKEKEIRDMSVIESILKEAPVCRVAFSCDNMPYIVPMNFAYKDRCLYLHSAREGRKMDMLRKNDNVCFEVDIPGEFVKSHKACGWGMKYRSVIGFGTAHLIENLHEKREGLDIIMEKYSGTKSHEYSEKEIGKVALIRIEIEKMTGKKSD